MRLRNRFLLVTFGVVTFIITTPILVLFTRGYQIDWQKHEFVKTGAFVVKTLPAGASVYLNDKLNKGKTPENILFQVPGDYDVRIEKNGYQSWTKRLTVRPQFATWINLDRDFVTLFYQSPTIQKNLSLSFAQGSKDGSEIAYVQNGQLSIYNTNSQSTQSLGNITNFQVPYTFTNNLIWSNGTKVWNLFAKQTTNVSLDPAKIKQVETNGSDIAILVSDQLFVSVNNSPQLLDKQVSGFTIDGENVWYVAGNLLKTYNLRTKQIDTQLQSLPTSTTAKIIRGEGHLFLILNNTLYAENDTLEKIYDGVQNAEYDNSYHALLFSNSNEILTYNPNEKSTTLVLRSISPVSDALLNNYTGYVFFINENKIKAIELDGRDHRNIYTIVDQIPGNSHFTLSTDGSQLNVFGDSSLKNYRIR